MEYLLKVSIIVVIFYMIYKVFLQRDTFFQWNRGFLLLGLITSFTLPFLVIPVYIERFTPVVLDHGFTSFSVIETTEEPFTILDYISIIYLAGVLFFFIRFVLQLTSLFAIIFRNDYEKQGTFNFVKVTANIPPFSFFNWIVYNPEQFSKTELDQIITHEKAHVRQYHSIDILLTQFCCIVLWYNPFIWLYRKDLKQNLEFLADNDVINHTKSKKAYQYTLLKTSVPSHQLVLSNNFYNSLIKKRIVMLHKSKSKKVNQFKFLIVIPLLTIFLMSFNTEEIYVSKVIEAEKSITFQIEKSKSAQVETEKDKPVMAGKTPKHTNKNVQDTDPGTKCTVETITKDFTDADFDNLKDKLKANGISVKFKGVKRNKDGDIIAVKINMNSKESSTNCSISSDDVIKPIKICFNDTGKVLYIKSADTNYKAAKCAATCVAK